MLPMSDVEVYVGVTISAVLGDTSIMYHKASLESSSTYDYKQINPLFIVSLWGREV